jgi:Uma2 family endonuclease
MNAMAQVAQRMTADEYLAMPYDGRRTDLVEGEVVVHQPQPLHQFVLRDLLTALHTWTSDAGRRGDVTPPLDVQLDEHNVAAPDILWYAHGRVPGRRASAPSPVPDLAIEVRSPSTWRYDIGAKKAAYERAGLPELWLVDTTASEVIVFRRSSPKASTFDVALELTVDDELTSPQLPGFALALSALFAD